MYPPAVAELKAEGALAEGCRHRPVPYLNKVLEQDPSSVGSTRVSIFSHSGELGARKAGNEAIHMIRKGQAYGSEAGAKAGLLHRFIVSMFGIEA